MRTSTTGDAIRDKLLSIERMTSEDIRAEARRVMQDDNFLGILATQLLAKMRAQARGNPPKKAPPSGRLLTIKEAAAYLGRSVSSVQHLIHRRKLGGVVSIDRRVFIDRVALDKFIEEHTT